MLTDREIAAIKPVETLSTQDQRLEADDRRLGAVASGQDDGRVGKALVEPSREPACETAMAHDYDDSWRRGAVSK